MTSFNIIIIEQEENRNKKHSSRPEQSWVQWSKVDLIVIGATKRKKNVERYDWIGSIFKNSGSIPS